MHTSRCALHNDAQFGLVCTVGFSGHVNSPSPKDLPVNVNAPNAVSIRDYATGYLNRFHQRNDTINIAPLAKGSSEQLFAIAADQHGHSPSNFHVDRNDIEGFLGARIDTDRDGVLNAGELGELDRAFNPATPGPAIGLADAHAARVFTKALPWQGVSGPIFVWGHPQGSPYFNFLANADNTSAFGRRADGWVGYQEIRDTVAKYGVNDRLDGAQFDRLNREFPGVF